MALIMINFITPEPVLNTLHYTLSMFMLGHRHSLVYSDSNTSSTYFKNIKHFTVGYKYYSVWFFELLDIDNSWPTALYKA